MSKKKRSKKRERIPVIDTLIDLAGAMTLDYLAAKRRQKMGQNVARKLIHTLQPVLQWAWG